MFKCRCLPVLLLGTFLLSASWAFILPTDPLGFQPDEGSHVAVIRYMAANSGALPPYRMGYDTAVHPPAYHALAAVVYSTVSPLLNNSGGILAVRLLSALIGSCTVYVVYLLARQTPWTRPAALQTAFLAALVPMRASLSGAVSNENLAALGATATLYILYSAIRRGFDRRRILLLSLWVAVGVGSKITCLGLVPAVVVGVFIARHPRLDLRRRLAVSLCPVVAVLLALGWWFIYNTVHYGDPLRKEAADRLWDGVQPGFASVSRHTGIAPWRYLLSILGGGWFSFWGQFDSMQYRLPYGVYAVLFGSQCLSLAGIALNMRRVLPRTPNRMAIFAATLTFCAWVLLIYIQYNWLHYTPQGRYFFVLIGPIALFIVSGFSLLSGDYRYRSWKKRWFERVCAAGLILLNLYALLWKT